MRVFTAIFALVLGIQLAAYSQNLDAIPQSIKDIRMGTLKVKTQPGKTVKVNQIQHAFPFGTCVSNFAGEEENLNSEERKIYLDTLNRYFNAIVHENAMKWRQLTDRWGAPWQPNYQVADTITNWALAKGKQVRGHGFFWGDERRVPDWVKALPDDSLKLAIKTHALEFSARNRGVIEEWDLNNEMLHRHYFKQRLGESIRDSMFLWASEGNPDGVWYLNDYGILTGGGEDNYVKQIRDFLSRGVNLGGVGIQGHFGSSVKDTAKLREELDSLGQFGLPIKITELDISESNKGKHAVELAKFLTLCFSHPAVEGVMLWGFYEGRMWRSNGHLWDENWNPTAASKTWHNLIFETWWSDMEVTSDENGECEIPVFYGTHEISIDGLGSKEITLSYEDGSKEIEFITTSLPTKTSTQIRPLGTLGNKKLPVQWQVEGLRIDASGKILPLIE